MYEHDAQQTRPLDQVRGANPPATPEVKPQVRPADKWSETDTEPES